jgi:hypothetical protein
MEEENMEYHFGGLKISKHKLIMISSTTVEDLTEEGLNLEYDTHNTKKYPTRLQPRMITIPKYNKGGGETGGRVQQDVRVMYPYVRRDHRGFALAQSLPTVLKQWKCPAGRGQGSMQKLSRQQPDLQGTDTRYWRTCGYSRYLQTIAL